MKSIRTSACCCVLGMAGLFLSGLEAVGQGGIGIGIGSACFIAQVGAPNRLPECTAPMGCAAYDYDCGFPFDPGVAANNWVESQHEYCTAHPDTDCEEDWGTHDCLTFKVHANATCTWFQCNGNVSLWDCHTEF